MHMLLTPTAVVGTAELARRDFPHIVGGVPVGFIGRIIPGDPTG